MRQTTKQGHLRSHFAVYHNHKETMAWAAILLYIVLVTQLIVIKSDVLQGVIFRVLLACVVAVLGGIVLGYLSIQFFLRGQAADYLAASIQLASKCLLLTEEEISALRGAFANLRQTQAITHRTSFHKSSRPSRRV